MKVCDVLKTPDSRISHFILFTFNFITGGRENTQSHIKCIWYTDNILDHVCIWWTTLWQQMASQTPPFLPQMCRKEEKTRCYISPNPALFPLPYCQLNHDVCTSHTRKHTNTYCQQPSFYRVCSAVLSSPHPAKCPPICWTLRQHANPVQRGNILSNEKLICMRTVALGGLSGPRPRGLPR